MSAPLPVRNLGIIAHIDAGKTTVSERILYYCHREHRMGEVDLGTATLDWMPEEQRRGITITAAATTVAWKGHQLNLIDTPGHVDFTVEVERALRILDGAVGVFCGTAGVQAQSETVWRQAERYRVPRLAFINKLDRVGADFFRVVDALRDRLRARAVPLQIPVGREKDFEGVVDLLTRRVLRFDAGSLGETVIETALEGSLAAEAEAWRGKLVEAVAEVDEPTLESYLTGPEIPVGALKAAIRRATLGLRLTPVLCGAALRNKGVQPLLDAICDYLPAPEDLGVVRGADAVSGAPVERRLSADEPLSALAFKTAIDSHGELVYVRVYSGRLSAGEQVHNSRTGRRDRAQKIYLLHANQRDGIEHAGAGAIVGVVGFKETTTGDTLSDPAAPVVLEPPRFPDTVVSMAIEPISIADRDRLLAALARSLREDPTLRMKEDKETGQVLLSGMGELHLEVVKERMERELRVPATFGAPRVAYRQTISRPARATGELDRQVGGKRLWARVEVAVEPRPGLDRPEVASELPRQALPRDAGAILVDAVRDGIETGGMLGFPLVQLRAVIAAVEVDPGQVSPVALQAAAAEALAGALAAAGVVILEPIMRFEVQVPDTYYGAVSTDLVGRRAEIASVTLEGDVRVLSGVVPLAQVFGYSTALRALSQGRGSISLEPHSYAPAPRAVQARFSL